MNVMTGWVIITIILILLAFSFGRRQGKRAESRNERHLDALQQAWQKGYDDALNYLGKNAAVTGRPPARAPSEPTTPEPATPEANWHAAAPSGPSAPAPSYGSAVPHQPAQQPAPAQPYLQPSAPSSAPLAQPIASPVALAAPAKPIKVLTKRERELRNINITLYVAALMIVAAGALFLSFALPPLSKLIAFFLLTAAFYGGGLLTYALKPSLRPAGAAFAGTGLALLPLCAIATYTTAGLSGPAIWLAFSAIGTVAVGYATLRFNSRVLAWVAVLILVSTAMASAAAMQRGVLYYMLILLVLSIILMILAVRSPRVRRSIFFQALFGTAQLLPAFVFALTLILFEPLTSRDMFWIFALLTAQLLLSVRLLANLRLVRFYAARASFMLMLAAGCHYLDFSGTATWVVIAFAFGIQAVAVLLYASGYRQALGLRADVVRIERAVLWGLGILAMTAAFALAPTNEESILRYVVLPLFMALSLPGLLRSIKLEAGVLAVLPLLSLVNWKEHTWSPLPAFAVALLGLSLAHHRAKSVHRFVLGHTRWVLGLVGAGVLGAAMSELTAPWYSGSIGPSIVIAALLVNLIWWAASLAQRSFLAPGTYLVHRMARVGASALIAVVLSLTLRLRSAVPNEVLPNYERVLFLGQSTLIWFMICLLLSLGVVIASGWRLTGLPDQNAPLQNVVDASALGLIGALYALSFGEDFWVLAIVVGLISLGYVLFNLRRSMDQRWKIINAAAAQVLFSSMVWWFATSLEFDIHGRFSLLLVSLGIPQLVRLAISIRSAKALRKELRFIAIGLLGGIPLATLAYGQIIGFDRGTVLLATLFFGLLGLAAFKADSALDKISRQFYLIAPSLSLVLISCIPATSLWAESGWIRSSWWSAEVACAILLVMSLVAVISEWRLRGNPKYSIAVGTAIFLPATVAAIWQEGTWWAVGAWLLATVALILMVHTRHSAWYAAAASLTLGTAIMRAVFELRQAGGAWRLESMDVVWSLLGTGIALYLLSIFHGRMKDPEPEYPEFGYRHDEAPGGASRIYFLAMLLALLLAGGIAHATGGQNWFIIGGAVVIFGVAVLVRYFELGQRLVAYAVDGYIVLAALLALTSYAQILGTPQASNMAAYACIVTVLLVLWRNIKADARLEKYYLLAASVAGSLTLLTALVESNSVAQIIGLVFFGALVAWGLKLGERLLIWWGAIAITLSILWFLRDLAFLWLVIIGMGLIAAAVFKLVKVDKQNSLPEQIREPQAPVVPPAQGPEGDGPR
ncbi:MAG: hypothetical protein ACTIND_05700 [Glutamicibacter arilaitensis]